MKVEVKQLFRDKFTKKLYEVGAEVDFDNEQRVADMVARGLAVIIAQVETKVEQPALWISK